MSEKYERVVAAGVRAGEGIEGIRVKAPANAQPMT